MEFGQRPELHGQQEQERGATDGLFVRAQTLLVADGDVRDAIVEIGQTNPHYSDYQTVMDFIFCELYDLRAQCIAYYNNKGPRLADLIAKRNKGSVIAQEKVVEGIDVLLEYVLHAAKGWKDSGTPVQWHAFKAAIEKELAAMK